MVGPGARELLLTLTLAGLWGSDPLGELIPTRT